MLIQYIYKYFSSIEVIAIYLFHSHLTSYFLAWLTLPYTCIFWWKILFVAYFPNRVCTAGIEKIKTRIIKSKRKIAKILPRNLPIILSLFLID